MLKKTAAEFVVITGGEPTIHELNPLVNALHQVGLPVHLETSGAFAITADFDWITLSPKRWKHPLQESIQKADELKIIVDHVSAMAEYSKLIDHQYTGSNIWLQPEWSQVKNKQILNAITEWIKRHGAPTVQAYKVTNTTPQMNSIHYQQHPSLSAELRK